MAAYVVAPAALASSFQSSIAEEAAKRGVGAEDAYALLPPTRTYTDAEIRKVLAQSGVDAVLIINVGDTGVVKEYAGTFFIRVLRKQAGQLPGAEISRMFLSPEVLRRR